MKKLLGFLLPFILFGNDDGPEPRLTGAPGDQVCTSCHSGTAVNGASGNVKITLAGAATYTPGVKQRLTVEITDSTARRFGFEMSARVGSDLANAQAGSFAAVDTSTRVLCLNGRLAPCTTASMLQFAEHTLAGYRSGANKFSVDWTPPATDVGPVRLYVAGNGANGNGSDSGDHIYTSFVELTAAASAPRPSISSTGGVVNGASFQASISPGAWITISGTNLASTTRTWSSAELAGGKLPTSLDNVSVSVNGKAAYVQYISPTQINALAPADTARGTVEVKVTANGQTSDAFMATLGAVAPAFFLFDGTFVAATHADSSLLGKAGLFPSAPTATTPAKPGETIILYGTGFGETSPAVADGTVTSVLAPLATPAKVTIGGVSATVAFGGLVPPFAGLYQFNVVVPTSLSAGDYAIVADVNGVGSPATAKITVAP